MNSRIWSKSPAHFTFLPLLILVFATAAPFAATETVKDYADSFFTNLEKTFDQIVKSSVVRKTSISPVDEYFFNMLKRNQVFHSLYRTNSKGVVINEVKRMEKPTRDYRNIADQPWFITMKKDLQPYSGFLKEDNGRYCLFWANPVLVEKRSGKVMNGAIAVKIDLWDCFYKIADHSKVPFQARLGQKTLFDEKWERRFRYQENKIVVAGVDNLILRWQKEEVVPELKPASVAADSLMKKDTTPVAGPVFNVEKSKLSKLPKLPFGLKLGKYQIMFVGLSLVIISAVILFRFFFWFRNWMISRRIAKEDRYL